MQKELICTGGIDFELRILRAKPYRAIWVSLATNSDLGWGGGTAKNMSSFACQLAVWIYFTIDKESPKGKEGEHSFPMPQSA